MIFRHQGRVRNVEIRPRLDPVWRQEVRDLRSPRRIEDLLRRIPILGLAPKRYSALDAQRGPHKLLEIRPLVLALALGHLAGEVRRLGTLRLPPDTARGGITVPITARQAQPCGSADGTGGTEPPGAEVVAAIEDAPHDIVVQGVRREGFT